MFRMTVQDVFVIRGRGLVATGRVEAGQVQVGDDVQVNGGLVATVDGLEAGRKKQAAATVGDNIGLLFRALEQGDVHAGSVIASPAAPGFHKQTAGSVDVIL